MSDTPLFFSVVIPLYNKEATVARAIQSVLSQTLQDFEIVVVDDGSTDNGARVVENIGDPRIRLIHQENQGVSSARNRGIAEAKHELIAFLDADDEWLPEFLETIRRMALRYPDCAIYATRYFLRTPSGKKMPAIICGLPDNFEGILDNYFEIAVRSHPPVCTSATCARKTALQHIGGFPVGVKSGEDLLTWARLAIKNKIAYFSSCMSIYNLSSSETYEAPPIRMPDKQDIVGNELHKLIKEYSLLKSEILLQYCALWHKMRASFYLRLGMNHEARIEIKKAIHYHFIPRLLIYWLLSFCPLSFVRYTFRCFALRNYD
jgi:glycosyltransferase involved in cell wall biosynthesis